MEPILNAKPFEIVVTHVEKEHGLVKVFGQVDLQTTQVVEKYLRAVQDQLEGGAAPQLGQLQVGQVVVARRQDRGWFRGKVVALDSASRRVVVALIDHGNTVPLPLANIRTGVHSQLSQVQPLAVSFFLGEVVPPGGDWSKPAIEFISDAVVGVGVCHALVTHRGHGHNFIRLYSRDSRDPLSQDMVQCGMAVSGLPNIDYLPPAHNYVQPSVPAPPVHVSNTAPHVYQTRAPPPLAVRVPPTAVPPPEYLPTQPPPSVIFRPMHLETGQWYPIYLSSTEGGPGDFCIQLESLSKKLEEVMMAANKTTLRPIPSHSIQAGVPCLARYSLDNTIYRAVVLKKDSSAKVYYLDYGNSEQVALDRVYTLPGDQLSTQMLSVRCSIYQWPQLSSMDKQRAKLRLETYCDRVLQCRVVSTETGGSFASARTMVQLYEDGTDIGQEIRLWLARPSEEGTEWRSSPGGGQRDGYGQLTITGSCEVYVSHPDHGPVQFYVSRVDTSAALAAVMRDIHDMSREGKLFPMNSATVGSPCLARYTDGVWYRASVQAVSMDRTEVSVYYVDYGNTATVPLASVGVIPPHLVSCLPAQAVTCRLSGVHSTTMDMMDRWRKVVTDKIRIKVEGVDSGVHVVQASSLPAPGVNINQEISPSAGDRRSGGDRRLENNQVLEVVVTMVESSNSWYGQMVHTRAEMREFLGRMSEFCDRSAQILYRDAREHHKGDICAVPDNRGHASNRYLRAIITREHKDNVEVRLMDVGGREKYSKNHVFSLPNEFSKRPEFGLICSFGCNPALIDNKLKDVMINSNLEVRIVKKIGDGLEVALTNSKSRKLKNNAVGSVLESLRSGDSKLNMLFERQNNKQNNKINNLQTNGSNGGAPVFERGDLRNSLREKRAARDREQQRAMLENKQGGGKNSNMGLGLANFKIGWRGDCKITWIYSPAHFYIQVVGDRHRRQFEDMMGHLQEVMRQGGQVVGGKVSPGQVVAARWTHDNCWYRGQVTGGAKQGKVEVFFVDFGNTERLDREDLGVLPQEFCNLDCQAVRVMLDGIEADWDKLDGKLSKYFDKDVYTVEFLSSKDRDGAFAVQLNDGDIVKSMLAQKIGKFKEGSEEKGNKKQKKDRKDKETSSESEGKSDKAKQNKKNDKSKGKKDDDNDNVARNDSLNSNHEEKLSKTAKLRKAGKLYTLGDFPGVASTEFVGNTITGLVSHWRSWKEFWIQVRSEIAEEMQDKLNTGDIGPVHGRVVKSIEEGECCLGYYQDTWHRATVLEKLEAGASVHVLMVDWGVSAVLNLADVRDGDFALYDHPPAVIKCKLDNKVDHLDKLLDGEDKKISVKVKSFKDNTFIVKVDKRGKKDKKEDGKSREDVVVVHVESVNNVWIVDKETMVKLDEIMKELSEIDTIAVDQMKTGDLCCVRFSEDNELYRAKIVEINEEDDNVLVNYIDYGNSELVETSEVFKLPENLSSMAPAAKLVSVKNAAFALDCDRSRNRLEKALGGDKVSVVVDDNQEASFWISGNKFELNKTLGWGKDDHINVFHQAESPRVECSVCHVEGDQVWIRMTEMDLFNKIMDSLQEKTRKLGKAGKVHVGDLVIARYSQDRRYYRAKVTRTQVGGGHRTVEVVFIDFGNKEVVEVGWLKSLPGEMRLCPGLAMLCHVDNSGADTCRMVTGQQLQQLGHVVVDLTKPRGNVVRLYSGGQRLGLLSGSSVSLPRVRLRLGDTWLGLLCNTNNKQLSVLDVKKAGDIHDMLEFYKTDVDITKPVVGEVYCNTMFGVRRRVMVKDKMILSEVDTSTNIKMNPATMRLETVTPRVRGTCPALVTCSPHTGTETRYHVPDTLVLVNVSDSNTLKVVQLKLKVSPTFTEEITDCQSNKEDFDLDTDKDNILTVKLPKGNWSSSDLVQVRDMLLLSSLGIKIHPFTNVDVTENVLNAMELDHTKPPVPNSSHNGVIEMINSQHCVRNIVNKAVKEGENVNIKGHDSLPYLKVFGDGDYKILRIDTEKLATLQPVASRISFSSKELSPVASVEVNDILLYSEDDDKDDVSRVVVTKYDDEDKVAEVYCVDSGEEKICHVSELFKIDPELAELPPAAFTANVITDDKVVKRGDVVNGKLEVSEDGELELHVAE